MSLSPEHPFTILAISLGILVISKSVRSFLWHHWTRYARSKTTHKYTNAIGLIGNTPVIELQSLSKATGTRFLAKCEFLNPGGSPKDRIALFIIEDAERRNCIRPHEGYTLYEGTVGSTGIALAWIAKAKGYQCHICIPDDQAQEKYQLLERLGARVEKVRPVSIVDRNQFCNLARTRALEDPKGYFADQFENLANFQAHYERTGPEIWKQTEGKLDMLVLGAGTGGTLAGCARYLKPKLEGLRVVLADPPGSGLLNKVRYDVMYSTTEAEGQRRRHQVDTIVEGVGNNRMTTNLEMVLGRAQWIQSTQKALDHLAVPHAPGVVPQKEHLLQGPWVDSAEGVTDREAVCMARYMVQHEGLFLGSSSCVNLVAAVKAVRRLDNAKEGEPPFVVLTMLCDSGQRHLTKFWSDDYLVKNGVVSADELSVMQFDDLSFIM